MRRALVLVLCAVVWGAPQFFVPPLASAAPLNCVLTVNPLTFPSYNVFSPGDTTMVISNLVQYTCNKNSTAVTIALGPSNGPPGYYDRRMAGDTDALDYIISLGGFTPQCGGGSGRVWGDSLLGNSTVSYFGISGRRGVQNSVVAYACIPAGQDVSVGSYSDFFTATISF